MTEREEWLDRVTPTWMQYDISDHIRGSEPRGCWHCGKPTRWLELNFEASLHPGPCTDAKWAEFHAA